MVHSLGRASTIRLLASEGLDFAIRVLEERFGAEAFDAAIKRRGKTREAQRGRKKEYDANRLIGLYLRVEFIRRLNLPGRISIEEACSQLIAVGNCTESSNKLLTDKRRFYEAKAMLRALTKEDQDDLNRTIAEMVHIAKAKLTS